MELPRFGQSLRTLDYHVHPDCWYGDHLAQFQTVLVALSACHLLERFSIYLECLHASDFLSSQLMLRCFHIFKNLVEINFHGRLCTKDNGISMPLDLWDDFCSQFNNLFSLRVKSMLIDLSFPSPRYTRSLAVAISSLSALEKLEIELCDWTPAEFCGCLPHLRCLKILRYDQLFPSGSGEEAHAFLSRLTKALPHCSPVIEVKVRPPFLHVQQLNQHLHALFISFPQLEKLDFIMNTPWYPMMLLSSSIPFAGSSTSQASHVALRSFLAFCLNSLLLYRPCNHSPSVIVVFLERMWASLQLFCLISEPFVHSLCVSQLLSCATPTGKLITSRESRILPRRTVNNGFVSVFICVLSSLTFVATEITGTSKRSLKVLFMCILVGIQLNH